MTNKIDSGPIYSSKNFDLKATHDIADIHKRVNKLFPKMVLETIKKIKKGIKPKKQNNNLVNEVYRQRNEADGEIIWAKMNSLQVFNFVRAITKPYLGAYYYNQKKIRKKFINVKCQN